MLEAEAPAWIRNCLAARGFKPEICKAPLHVGNGTGWDRYGDVGLCRNISMSAVVRCELTCADISYFLVVQTADTSSMYILFRTCTFSCTHARFITDASKH